MKLEDIDSKLFDPDIILLETPSIKMLQFLQDKIKRKYQVSKDTTITIENKSDYKKVKDVTGVVPFGSTKWFVEVDIDKNNNKDFINLIKQSTTCLFFCTASKYRYYKAFMDAFKGVNDINIADYYLTFLRRGDFIYLYDAFVPEDKRLASSLFTSFMKGYSSDIDAVFELLLHLAKGEKFNSMKDISDICGFGGLTVETYIFSLLRPLSGSDKGLEKVIKNRVEVGSDLGSSLGYGALYGRLTKSIKMMCELKMLIMSGVVNKRVVNIPKVFEDNGIAKYQRYIWRLKEIPMSEFLLLRQCIGSNKWYKDIDLLCFLYKYYSLRASRLVKEV